jgi:ADP-ribose pyrophosphatase YjhB (NUDIX family)
MLRFTHFKNCPRCGKTGIRSYQINALKCPACGFLYFHNTASAVAAIIVDKGKILLVKRDHAPKKGYWDLPGGFVTYNESIEAALAREIREELGCALKSLTYFDSFPNTYAYKGVTYFTCDVFFIGRLPRAFALRPNHEIAEIVFVKPDAIDYSAVGFRSMRAALKKYASFK